MPRRSLTRSLAAVSLAAALATAGALPASAAPKPGPDTIALVTGSSPEGISSGPGDTFYAGARAGGAVYVGNTRNGKLRTLVRGTDSAIAVGLLHDESTNRLWVAGGTTGVVTAYHARSGRVLFSADTGGGRFLNDVAITRDAVYVTDSRSNRLIVIPTPGGRLPEDDTFDTVTLSGDYVQPAGFGANGIRVLPSGELLLVSGRVLYRVDPRTGVADAVEVSGGMLRGGDGLVLDGRTLYVVNGFGGNEVVVLRLSGDARSATITGSLTDPELDRPTTAAIVDGALYVVNGRFTTLNTDPNAPVYVTRLPLSGR